MNIGRARAPSRAGFDIRRERQWWKSLGCAWAVSCLLTPEPVAAGVLDRLQFQRIPPLQVGPRSVAFGAGQFVAVGPNNVITVSSDGMHWTNPLAPEGVDLSSETPGDWVQSSAVGAANLSFVNGEFLAFNGIGATEISSDGLVWTTTSERIIPALVSAIAYGNGAYAAVGPAGALVSGNAAEWSMLSFPLSFDINGIDYAGGRFFVFGQGSPSQIWSSPDGAVWTASTVSNDPPFSPGYGSRVVGGNGKFILASGSTLAISTDAQAWSLWRISVSLGDLTFGNGMFAAPPDWTEIGSVTNDHLRAIFVDPFTASNPHRFYRTSAGP
jgi:hypothetical protein